MIKKIIIFFGPPGSGKGTQAKVVTKLIGADYISTGKILAKTAEDNDSIGSEIKNYVKSGQFVPDEIVNKIVLGELQNVSDIVVLDGFPRTVAQADFVSEKFPQAEIISFYLEISDTEVEKRILSRKICDKCGKIFPYPENIELEKCDSCGGELKKRIDDNPQTVRNRLKIYHHETAPLVKYFQSKKQLVTINGNMPIEKVTKEIIKFIK